MKFPVFHSSFGTLGQKIRGERRQALAQMIDITATLLEYFGYTQPSAMQRIPQINALQADLSTRDAAIFGVHGGHINITDGRYIYIRAQANASNALLYEYTLMPTHMRNFFSVEELQYLEMAEPFDFTKGLKTLKTPAQPWINSFEHGMKLYDLKLDPNQDISIENPAVEAQLLVLMVKLMK